MTVDFQKQIDNLKKQNEGMEMSFKNKSIKFTKLSIDNIDPETELMLLKDYNNYLKNISKNNRPKVESKPKVETNKPTNESNKQTLSSNDKDCDEDELTKEEKITYPTVCNMEEHKRLFFSKDYDAFNELINVQLSISLEPNLRFYKANYKWSDDNTGKPDFVARNLLRGFVQGLDNYRKYLMVCFRCILVDEETKKYRYPSYWIVNTDVDLNKLLGSTYDDYDFIKVEDEDAIEKMLLKMRKNEDENDECLVGETYLH